MFRVALHTNITKKLHRASAFLALGAGAALVEILDAVCDLIATTTTARFEIELASSNWPVDVRTDLSVFLEQLQPLLEFLGKRDGVFVVSMYEQGIEANIVIETHGADAKVHCEPLIAEAPIRFDRHTETINRDVLVTEFLQIRSTFLELCEGLCPEILALPVMSQWITATSKVMSHPYNN